MITFNDAGLTIDPLETTLTEWQELFRTAFGNNIATTLDSSAGQMQRLLAMRESQIAEELLLLYQSLDPRLAEGTNLDQRNSLLGIDREAADQAEVLGTATGTPATNIPNGTELAVGGYSFDVVDGPYVIGGGGTIANVRLRAVDNGPVDVTVLGAWTILDSVAGFTSFNDTSQPNAGRLVETDAEFRVRANTERYRRGQGPLLAIEASVSAIDEVTYVRAWHNITDDPVDANGIPLHAINVVVEGGEDVEVAEAIWASGPAGHLFYGNDVTVDVDNGVGGTVEISFDRVLLTQVYVRATLTTSTAEDPAPDDLEALVMQLLVDYAAANWDIGTDVVVHRLVGALSGIQGVDDILVETSLDGVSWATTKLDMSIRQRGTLAEADITVIED